MNKIYVRYGESLSLEGTIDDDMVGLESVTLYVGETGPNEPVLTVPGVIEGNTVKINKASVEIPVGEYKYQVNAVYEDGFVEKFPDVQNYSTELPDFIVTEVVDVVEEDS